MKKHAAKMLSCVFLMNIRMLLLFSMQLNARQLKVAFM